MKRMVLICILVCGLMLGWSNVCADGFYVIPVRAQVKSWDQKIPGATRFKLVLDDAAVLDKETGLVWERIPVASKTTWSLACTSCFKKEVANRKGWRLPTIEELSTLVDSSNNNPSLPINHPFNNIQYDVRYWTKTTVNWVTTYAWAVSFSNGSVNEESKDDSRYCWCVRGGYGPDAY